jgi:hypothetical protein
LGIGDWGLGIGDWAQSPIPIFPKYINSIFPNSLLLLFKKKIIYKQKKFQKWMKL